MSQKQRNHSPKFKAKVALAALQRDKTLAELSSEFGVYSTQISQWKKELLENSVNIFGGQTKSDASEQEIRKLHAKIGQLTMENDFLARVLGR